MNNFFGSSPQRFHGGDKVRDANGVRYIVKENGVGMRYILAERLDDLGTTRMIKIREVYPDPDPIIPAPVEDFS